jgi:hypothetical protein
MEAIDGTSFNTAGRKTANALTGAFILHPIAAGLTFIAALIAVGGVVGSLVGTILGVLAWILTIVVMAIDFSIFGVSSISSITLLHSASLTQHVGHQKPHQQGRKRIPRRLQRGHVDLSRSHDSALTRNHHCVLHLLY